MKIAIVAQYFPPTDNACANRMDALARRLQHHGHDVTVVCGMPNYPDGIKPAAYRKRYRVQEDHDGIRVLRTYEYATPNAGAVRRLLNYLSFAWSAACVGKQIGPQDLLLVSSPPLFAAWSALRLQKRCGARLVADVRDLWPQSLVEIGHATERSPAVRILARLEAQLYARAGAITCATRGIQTHIRAYLAQRGDHQTPVHFCPNGITEDLEASASDYVRKPDALTILYAGNQSYAQDLMQYIGFAQSLQAEDDAKYRRVQFVFAGDGEQRAEMEDAVRTQHLENVVFLDWMPRARSYDVIQKCDVCLVSLRDIPLFRGALPSKTFEYMFFNKPILSNVDGELRAVLDEAGCGYYHQPHDYASFRTVVDEMLDDPDERAARAERAGPYVREHFIRDRILDRLHEQLVAVGAKRRADARDG